MDDSFSFLGLENPLIISYETSRRNSSLDSRAIQDIASYDRLLPVLLEYNKQALELDFHKSIFSCHVCFGEKFGSQCIKFFDCGHVFCKICMRDYFTVQISEGNVKGLNCPDEKCESQAHPCQVKEIFQRYSDMLSAMMQFSILSFFFFFLSWYTSIQQKKINKFIAIKQICA